jgi:hypothetical protein
MSNGERTWKDIEDRLKTPLRTDVGKFSFVNRTIADWNRLPEGTIGTSLVKTRVFIKKRVRKIYQ